MVCGIIKTMLEQLKNIGLSDNEAKVYMAMLELGPSPVVEIARKAEVNRPTAYVQIESLKKKGLVSMQTKGKKNLFIAESPARLEFYLDSELKDVEQKKDELGKILPDLDKLFASAGSRPSVRFFEGKEGVLAMQDMLLKSGVSEISGVSSMDSVVKIFPNIQKEYSPERVKRGIRSRLIYSYSGGPVLKESDEKMLRESRFISSDKMPFIGDITVYGNSVAIIAFEGKVSGVVIEHPEIAKSFGQFFEFMWNLAGTA